MYRERGFYLSNQLIHRGSIVVTWVSAREQPAEILTSTRDCALTSRVYWEPQVDLAIFTDTSFLGPYRRGGM